MIWSVLCIGRPSDTFWEVDVTMLPNGRRKKLHLKKSSMAKASEEITFFLTKPKRHFRNPQFVFRISRPSPCLNSNSRPSDINNVLWSTNALLLLFSLVILYQKQVISWCTIIVVTVRLTRFRFPSYTFPVSVNFPVCIDVCFCLTKLSFKRIFLKLLT